MKRIPTPALILILLLALGTLAALTLPVAAQEAAESFGEEVTVTEVLLDVLVTDKKGNVIVGLLPEDFVVDEDGKAVEVSSVTFYSNRPLLGGESSLDGAGDVDQTPKNRYFILFFDEQQRASSDNPGLNLLQRQLEAARESRRWVKKEMLLDDYVAVVSYDAKLKVHQDFTQDKQLLLKAIDGAVTGKDPGANWPSRLPTEVSGASLRANLPRGQGLRDETKTIYDALQVLAQATGEVVGRKNLLMFSTGFGELTTAGFYRPDKRYYGPTVQALNDNNVAVYALDLVPNTVTTQLSSSLNQLADETGGRYYTNFTTFLTPLRQVADENSGYYLLSYRSEHPVEDSGFQKVSVETRNPEFRVRAREGYLFGD